MAWAGWYNIICVLSVLAMVTHIIGFSTPGWVKLNSSKIHHTNTEGLWMICTESSCGWLNDDYIGRSYVDDTVRRIDETVTE